MSLARKPARHASADQLSFAFADAQPIQTQRPEPCNPPQPMPPMNAPIVASIAPAVHTKRAVRARKLTRSDAHVVGYEDRRLTVEEAADVLSVSVKTLEAWRRLGKGPVFVKLGRSVRYTLQALDQFTRDRTVRNSAEGRLLDVQR